MFNILLTPNSLNSSTCDGSVNSGPRNKKFGRIVEIENVGIDSDSVDGGSGRAVEGDGGYALSLSPAVEFHPPAPPCGPEFEIPPEPYPKKLEWDPPCKDGCALMGPPCKLENGLGVPGVCGGV